MAPPASVPAPEPALYPRLAEPRLEEALADSPVVLIHGPRQCGKTTLAQAVGPQRGYACFSFDDEVLRAAALADSAAFVGDLPEHVVLDEVQRVPAPILPPTRSSGCPQKWPASTGQCRIEHPRQGLLGWSLTPAINSNKLEIWNSST